MQQPFRPVQATPSSAGCGAETDTRSRPGPIEEKVAQVGQLSQQIEAIGKKLDPLPAQLVESEKKVTELNAKLDELRKQVSAAHSRAPADRIRDGSPVSSEKGEASITRPSNPE